jgi:hypothetical protein
MGGIFFKKIDVGYVVPPDGNKLWVNVFECSAGVVVAIEGLPVRCYYLQRTAFMKTFTTLAINCRPLVLNYLGIFHQSKCQHYIAVNSKMRIFFSGALEQILTGCYCESHVSSTADTVFWDGMRHSLIDLY